MNGTFIIYTAHGFHFCKGAPKANWILYYPIEKILSKYTDCLITINREDFEIAKRNFKTKTVVLVNGIGINVNKFNFTMNDAEKNEYRESLGLMPNDFVIIYVAELNKRKNQGMLIDAIKELSEKIENVKVLLVGKDSMNNLYQSKVEKLGLNNTIKFLGYRKDIAKLMKISDLAVSTSKREGLPVNIMEAMLCGLPIIVTDCRGNRDLLQNEYKDNIIKLGDVKGLTTKIEEIYSAKLRNVKYDISPYTKEHIEQQMRKIYKYKGEEQ